MKSLTGFRVGSAACLGLTLALACTAHSQQTSDTASPAETASSVDPKAHDAALRLVKILEIKEKMVAGVDTMLQKGIDNMKAQFPDLRPEFAEEWRKRMKARINPDDFVAIVSQVYEKHFTADELDRISDIVSSRKEGKTVELPDALKEKFQSNFVAIQSDIIGGTTQLGARLGGEVGEEIQKDHPDWAPAPAKPAQPAK